MPPPVEQFDPPALCPPLEEMHVTSPFGHRRSPITGRPEGHPGVDLRAALGTSVFAAADGLVTHSYFSKGNHERGLLSYGNRIVIQHAGDWQTSYAHLANRMVASGQEVKAGQLIGFSGNTGASTGPHLHFELRRGDVPHDPMPHIVRPVPWRDNATQSVPREFSGER